MTTLSPALDVSALHPRKTIVTRVEMSAIIAAGNHHVSRKYDGEFSSVQIAGATILTEFMRGEISGHFYTASDREMFKRWPGGWLAALTVAEVHGENILTKSARDRWGILCSFANHFTPDIILADMVTNLNMVMLAAEGVCAVPWGDSWGNMLCVKQNQIYLCRVNRVGSTQSVGICDAHSGQNRGNVKMGGGRCDQVRVGSLIRVEAMGETDSGKLRQPVPCREWLHQF